jgi:hypothetical protein
MASNEPTGDNRRIGAVRKRSQRKGKVPGKRVQIDEGDVARLRGFAPGEDGYVSGGHGRSHF